VCVDWRQCIWFQLSTAGGKWEKGRRWIDDEDFKSSDDTADMHMHHDSHFHMTHDKDDINH
jgi:hypothetical protein